MNCVRKPAEQKPSDEPAGRQHPPRILLCLLGSKGGSWLEVNAVCNIRQACLQVPALTPLSNGLCSGAGS